MDKYQLNKKDINGNPMHYVGAWNNTHEVMTFNEEMYAYADMVKDHVDNKRFRMAGEMANNAFKLWVKYVKA